MRGARVCGSARVNATGVSAGVGAIIAMGYDAAVGSGAEIAVVAGKRIELGRLFVARRGFCRHLKPLRLVIES